MPWKRDAPGCPCCVPPEPTCVYEFRVRVKGCSDNGTHKVAGITVNFYLGNVITSPGTAVLIGSYVTDANGEAAHDFADFAPAGLVSVSVADYCGYEAKKGAWTITVCTDRVEDLILNADATHQCCQSPDGWPVSKGDLDFTCDTGSGTLEYNGAGYWEGVVALTVRIGKPTPWNTYDCECPPPTGTLTIAKFEYTTEAVDFLVRYYCGGSIEVRTSGGGSVKWHWGRTGCETCDWCFGDPSHVPADEGSESAVWQSTGTSSSTCGTFAASGTMAAAGTTKSISNFDCPLDPSDPGTCETTPGSLVGDWAVSS